MESPPLEDLDRGEGGDHEPLGDVPGLVFVREVEVGDPHLGGGRAGGQVLGGKGRGRSGYRTLDLEVLDVCLRP